MAFIKSAADIAEKWGRVTPQRATDYAKGVESPRADWATEAAKASENWKAAITAAATRDAFKTGVVKAGTETWKKGAREKGPSRFSEGVQIAAPKYQKNWGMYRDVIEKTALPPRFPSGDPRNLERVRAISTALRQAKTGGR